jgi:hypothetical protein
MTQKRVRNNDGKFQKGERRSIATEFKKGISANPSTQFKPGHKHNHERPEGYVLKDNYGYRIKRGDKWVRAMHPDPMIDEVMRMAKKLKTLLREKHRELARRHVSTTGGAKQS